MAWEVDTSRSAVFLCGLSWTPKGNLGQASLSIRQRLGAAVLRLCSKSEPLSPPQSVSLPGLWSPLSFQTVPPDPVCTPPPHTCCFRVSQDGPIPVLSPWPLMLCTVPAWLNSASSQSAHPRMTVTMAGVSSKCKAHVGVCRGESADWRRQERGARGMDRRCQPLGGHGGRWVSSTLSYVTCGFPACR